MTNILSIEPRLSIVPSRWAGTPDSISCRAHGSWADNRSCRIVITLGYLRYSPDDFHELLGECRSAETIGSTRLGKIHIQDNSPIGVNAVVNERASDGKVHRNKPACAEAITILILFHSKSFRFLKHSYTQYVCKPLLPVPSNRVLCRFVKHYCCNCSFLKTIFH